MRVEQRNNGHRNGRKIGHYPQLPLEAAGLDSVYLIGDEIQLILEYTKFRKNGYPFKSTITHTAFLAEKLSREISGHPVYKLLCDVDDVLTQGTTVTIKNGKARKL